MNMSPDIRVVAILSPGDMGHAIGRELRQQGWDVIACLGDRSERTQGLAQQAGIRPVNDLCQLVTEAELKFQKGPRRSMI